MRRRLYARGQSDIKAERHALRDEPVEVATDWSVPETRPDESGKKSDLRSGASAPVADPDTAEEAPPKRRRYRTFVLLGSFLILVFVAALTSVFLYFGGNQISNANIGLTVSGPALVGGGETLPLSVTVANNNSVTIESATLIVKYPPGTRSVGDTPRNLFEERIPISDIAPNEVQSVPLQVAVFGEESDQKEIAATIEYRINNSNGMFYKDADAFEFQISSSPLVMRIDAIEKVASGQTVDITMTAVSNASTPLYDILVTADYPSGFRYEQASPEPVFGQNVWRIDELLPEQRKTITLTGVVGGLTEETFRVNVEAGPANPDNQYLVGSVLSDVYTEFTIERPFIDVDIAIAGDNDGEVVLDQGRDANVQVRINNTLDETVYDMAVEVVPNGNALTETSIISRDGFYDSNLNAVRWEVPNSGSFDQVFPGDSRTLDFTIAPGPTQATAAFDLTVNVYARRVAETSAQETLVGSVSAEGKYSSSLSIGSQAGRNVGRFGDSGPTPPQVGETTTYTLSVVAEAGANDMTDAVIKTSFPIYVEWLDSFDAPGDVTFNTVNKQLEWNAGTIPAGQRKELTFQVAIQPSVSQVGSAPTLMNSQTLRATDRFSGERLQDESPAVTTELSTELGYPAGNGSVIR